MKKFLIASSALLATAAVAQGAPVASPAPPAPLAPPMDDHVMTRAEVVAMVRDHFGRLDSNKDGAITTDEMMRGREKMAEHMKDGRPGGPHVMMMREGPMADPNVAFDRLDANKDGAISRDEFAKAHEQRIEKRIEIREGRKEAMKDKDGRRELRMHRMGGKGSGRMIVMADSDHDGKITLAEAEAMALQHFDQMDANHDGQITPEERRAGRQMIIRKVVEEKKTAS